MVIFTYPTFFRLPYKFYDKCRFSKISRYRLVASSLSSPFLQKVSFANLGTTFMEIGGGKVHS